MALSEPVDGPPQLAKGPRHPSGHEKPQDHAQAAQHRGQHQDVPSESRDGRLQVSGRDSDPGDTDPLLVHHDRGGDIVNGLVLTCHGLNSGARRRPHGEADVPADRLAHRIARGIGVREHGPGGVQHHRIHHDVLPVPGPARGVAHDFVEAPQVVLEDEVAAESPQVLHQVHAALPELRVERRPLVPDHGDADQGGHPRDHDQERGRELGPERPLAERTDEPHRPAVRAAPAVRGNVRPTTCSIWRMLSYRQSDTVTNRRIMS